MNKHEHIQGKIRLITSQGRIFIFTLQIQMMTVEKIKAISQSKVNKQSQQQEKIAFKKLSTKMCWRGMLYNP